MSIPGVSGPVHPGSPGQGLAWNIVQVKTVEPEANLAICVDQLTKEHRLPLNGRRAKGFPPAVGETWIITREYGGVWSFALLMNGDPEGETIPLEQVRDTDTGAARGDQHLYGDVLSTMHRREITTTMSGVQNNVLYVYRMYTARDITAIAMKWAIGSTGRSGGDHYLALYVGSSTTSLSRWSLSLSNVTPFNSAAPNTIQTMPFGTTYEFPARSHVLLASWINGATTLPHFAGTGSLPAAAYINRPGAAVAAYKNVATYAALPQTINLGDGSWTSATGIAWCALA